LEATNVREHAAYSYFNEECILDDLQTYSPLSNEGRMIVHASSENIRDLRFYTA